MLFNVESSIGSVPRNADGWLMAAGIVGISFFVVPRYPWY